jgi:thiosulfate/3-mercaptopyruvate sulfurtransferase
MPYTTLISPLELSSHLADPDWAIIDARFVLTAPELGEQNYRLSHIPGALYVHPDHDLATPPVPGKTGRHPWLSVDAAAGLFSHLGIDERVQVVIYDEAGGALAAVRVWWMLRWLGHEAAAVLDGGLQGWNAANLPTRPGVESRPPRHFTPRTVRSDLLVDIDYVERIRQDPAYRLLDARSFERYQGKNETLDPVAGHIPGAINAPYTDLLTEKLAFRPPEELRARLAAWMGGVPIQRTVVYCGSGVTSIMNLLAMLHVGLGEARLYPGSWSEWIADRTRPIAVGE